MVSRIFWWRNSVTTKLPSFRQLATIEMKMPGSRCVPFIRPWSIVGYANREFEKAIPRILFRTFFGRCFPAFHDFERNEKKIHFAAGS